MALHMVVRSPVFLVSLALLLANDFYLKAQFGNWFTGKLSDFAGLVAFALFWSAVFPRHAKLIHIGTGVAFVVWKLPLTDPMVVMWNAVSPLDVARVTDLTDLIVLTVLPASYLYFAGGISLPAIKPRRTELLKMAAISALSLFAFLATSTSYSQQIDEGPPESKVYLFETSVWGFLNVVDEMVNADTLISLEKREDKESQYWATYAGKVCNWNTSPGFEVTFVTQNLSRLTLLRINPWYCENLSVECVDSTGGLKRLLNGDTEFPTERCLHEEFEELFVEPIRARLASRAAAPINLK